VYYIGYMVIEKHRYVKTMLRSRPVAKQYGYGREYLHTDAMVVALVHAHGGVPAVGLNLAKEFIVFHHAGTAGAMMLQVYEAAIAKSLTPSG
jgi:hypothetical protein